MTQVVPRLSDRNDWYLFFSLVYQAVSVIPDKMRIIALARLVSHIGLPIHSGGQWFWGSCPNERPNTALPRSQTHSASTL